MAKKYTRSQLWAIVHEADTIEKIMVAKQWFRDETHFEMVKAVGGYKLWDDLMESLEQTRQYLEWLECEVDE